MAGGAIVGSLIGAGAKAVLKRLLRKTGDGILGKVAEAGGQVVGDLAKELGKPDDAEAILEAAQADPVAFARAVEAVERAEGHRWAVALAETRHGRFFVSGARPSILWACFLLLIYAGFVVTFANWCIQMIGYLSASPELPALITPPDIVWDTLVWLVPLLYGIRSLEGMTGSKKEVL